MADPKIEVNVVKTTTWVFDSDAVEAIMRAHLGVDDRARVEIECGYDFLREIRVVATEQSNG